MFSMYPLNSNELFQIHNYSFAAIKSFVQEVQKHPPIYNGFSSKNMINAAWSTIVSGCLENDHFKLTSSERAYWDRIYRELWRWIRLVYTSGLVFSGSSDNIEIANIEKFSWMENLAFLKPFIDLSLRSMQENSDRDPYISIKIVPTHDLIKTVDPKYMVFWQHYDRVFVYDAMYFNICVHAVICEPAGSTDNFISEIEEILKELCEDDSKSKTPNNDSVSTESTKQKQPEVKGGEEEVWVIDSDDEDFVYVMGLLPKLRALPPNRNAQVKLLMINALSGAL